MSVFNVCFIFHCDIALLLYHSYITVLHYMRHLGLIWICTIGLIWICTIGLIWICTIQIPFLLID